MAAVATDTTALFAGGLVAGTTGTVSDAVDLFTVPTLAGSVGSPGRGDISVSLVDAGASALPGPDSIAIYASLDGEIDSGAVLLGSVRERNPLAAGVSEHASVPISIPTTLAPGSYHLIAAAGPPGQLVEFAVQRRLLTIGRAAGVTAGPERVPLFIPAAPPGAAVFGASPISAGPLFDDAGELLK
jgi:hypothetical protein